MTAWHDGILHLLGTWSIQMFSGKIYRNLLILLLVYGKNVLKDQIERLAQLKYIFNIMELYFKHVTLILNSFIFLNIKC